MEEFVAYIIKNLVSLPEEVKITCSEEQDRVRIEIHVAKQDVGKVIGRRGNTINALRTIVRTVATRLGRKVQVELIQSDDEPQILIESEENEVEAEENEVEAEAEAETVVEAEEEAEAEKENAEEAALT